MADALLEALNADDIEVRLDAVSRLDSISPDAREPLFKKIATDLRHEVREAAAQRIALSPSMFTLFLVDPDPQVRVAIINNSIPVRCYFPSSDTVFGRLTESVRDPSVEVRCALARMLHQHAKLDIAGNSLAFVLKHIVPLVEKLLIDQNDDVRIAASATVKELTIQFGFDFIFEHLRPGLQAMLTDLQWRVRNIPVELLFNLSLVCSAELFEGMLFDFVMAFLKDPCYRVRRFALAALPNLAQRFGPEWLKTTLVNKLKEMEDSTNFIHRQTYMLAVSSLMNFFPVQYQSNYVFQSLIRKLHDPVHNVVLLALELLQEHRDELHPFRVQNELKPVLDGLIENRLTPSTTRERAEAFRFALSG
jgi:hypothetical protein